ncbi:MAG: hypothetical protein IKP10_00620 [Clostridia bacterium]|nr:hypothetical protein [Clostridia bacterium]
MTPEEREALREQDKEDRKRRRRHFLRAAWEKACWGIAPLSAVWLILLVIVLISEKLYTRTGEWVACAILAVPGVILLAASLWTLRRVLKAGRQGGQRT